MQFFFVQVKAARGILKLIHELMQTELQNLSGEARARKFTCEQDVVKQLSTNFYCKRPCHCEFKLVYGNPYLSVRLA